MCFVTAEADLVSVSRLHLHFKTPERMCAPLVLLPLWLLRCIKDALPLPKQLVTQNGPDTSILRFRQTLYSKCMFLNLWLDARRRSSKTMWRCCCRNSLLWHLVLNYGSVPMLKYKGGFVRRRSRNVSSRERNRRQNGLGVNLQDRLLWFSLDVKNDTKCSACA